MKKHFLLIDDDEDELEIFQSALRKMDSRDTCSYVKGCEEAIRLLKNFRPDYVFIDFNMPLADGLDCIRAIRDIPGMTEVPLFLYSTTIDPKTKQEALEIGAKECFKKPLRVSVLAETIRSVVTTY
jgi:CheY-like chemotaxis protein